MADDGGPTGSPSQLSSKFVKIIETPTVLTPADVPQHSINSKEAVKSLADGVIVSSGTVPSMNTHIKPDDVTHPSSNRSHSPHTMTKLSQSSVAYSHESVHGSAQSVNPNRASLASSHHPSDRSVSFQSTVSDLLWEERDEFDLGSSGSQTSLHSDVPEHGQSERRPTMAERLQNCTKDLSVITDEEFDRILSLMMANFTENNVSSVLAALHGRYLNILHLVQAGGVVVASSKPDVDELDEDNGPVVELAVQYVDYYQADKERWEEDLSNLKRELTDLQHETVKMDAALQLKTVAYGRLQEEDKTVQSFASRAEGLRVTCAVHQEKVADLQALLDKQREKFDRETAKAILIMEARKREEFERKDLDLKRYQNVITKIKEESQKLKQEILHKKLAINRLSKIQAEKDAGIRVCQRKANKVSNDLKHFTAEFQEVCESITNLKKNLSHIAKRGMFLRDNNQRLKDKLMETRMLNLGSKQRNVKLSMRNAGMRKELEMAHQKIGQLYSFLKSGKSKMAVAQRELTKVKDAIAHCKSEIDMKTSKKKVFLQKIKEVSHQINLELKETKRLERVFFELRNDLSVNNLAEAELKIFNKGLERDNMRMDMIWFSSDWDDLTISNELTQVTLKRCSKNNHAIANKLVIANILTYKLQGARNRLMSNMFELLDKVSDSINQNRIMNHELRDKINETNYMTMKQPLRDEEKRLAKQLAKQAFGILILRDKIDQEQKEKTANEYLIHHLNIGMNSLQKENRMKSRYIAWLAYKRNELCSLLTKRKAELGLVLKSTNELTDIQKDGLLKLKNLTNDTTVMKKGIRQLRLKVKNYEKLHEIVEKSRANLIAASKNVAREKNRLHQLEARHDPGMKVITFDLENMKSRYELFLHCQALTKRLVIRTQECGSLENDLLMQVTYMLRLKEVVITNELLSEPGLQREILFQRVAVNRKEKKLKALTAELNMNKTQEKAYRLALKKKPKTGEKEKEEKTSKHRN